MGGGFEFWGGKKGFYSFVLQNGFAGAEVVSVPLAHSFHPVRPPLALAKGFHPVGLCLPPAARCISPRGRVVVVKPALGLAEPAFSLLPDGAGPGSHSSPGSCPPAIAPPTCPRLLGERAASRLVLLLLLLC